MTDAVCRIRHHYLSRYERALALRRRRYQQRYGESALEMSTKMAEKNRRARRGWMAVSRQLATIGELKWKDTDVSDTTIDTTEVFTLLNGMTKGTDVGNRVGRQITMRSVQFRGYFTAEDGDKGYSVFWAILYDKQPNAAAPVWTDVYTTDAVYPLLRNLDNRKRFKILTSGWAVIPKTGADWEQVPVDVYKKINLKTEYDSSDAGTVADITYGSLHFIMRGQANAATAPALYGSVRLRYSDM